MVVRILALHNRGHQFNAQKRTISTKWISPKTVVCLHNRNTFLWYFHPCKMLCLGLLYLRQELTQAFQEEKRALVRCTLKKNQETELQYSGRFSLPLRFFMQCWETAFWKPSIHINMLLLNRRIYASLCDIFFWNITIYLSKLQAALLRANHQFWECKQNRCEPFPKDDTNSYWLASCILRTRTSANKMAAMTTLR